MSKNQQQNNRPKKTLGMRIAVIVIVAIILLGIVITPFL